MASKAEVLTVEVLTVEILFVLIPISMLLAGLGLSACIWAIRSGQYKDLASPPQFLVFEDHDALTLVDKREHKVPPSADHEPGKNPLKDE